MVNDARTEAEAYRPNSGNSVPSGSSSSFCSDCSTPITEPASYNADTNSWNPASSGTGIGGYERSSTNLVTVGTNDTPGSGLSDRNGSEGASIGGVAGAAIDAVDQFGK